MPLSVGDNAPSFSAQATNGTFAFPEALGNEPLILFFYPKAFTSVCTKEACTFRDAFEEVRNLQANVVGISRDSLDMQQKFKKEHKLPFELIADKSGEVGKKYKALIPIIGTPRRVTYLIDKHQKVQGVYENMFDARTHLEKMLAELKK